VTLEAPTGRLGPFTLCLRGYRTRYFPLIAEAPADEAPRDPRARSHNRNGPQEATPAGQFGAAASSVNVSQPPSARPRDLSTPAA